jgi:hypothetical protein
MAKFFDTGVRRNGYEYKAQSRVRLKVGNQYAVEATVQGTARYTIRLNREDDDLVVNCTCPAFADRGPCKHIWATLIEADEKHYLRGQDGSCPISLFEDVDEAERDDGDDDDFEDWLDDDEDSDEPAAIIPFTRSASRSAPHLGRPKSPKKTAPPVAPWKLQLDAIQQPTTGPAVGYGAGWPAGKQIIYILDMAETTRNGAVIMQLASRERKQNGEWRKPKPVTINHNQIQALPDAADRQIAAVLAGAQDHYYSNHYNYGRISPQLQLPKNMQDVALPMMLATGRCFLRQSGGEVEAEPLKWDPTTVRELALRVRRGDNGKHYLVEPCFKRGEEFESLDVARVLLSGGFIVIGQTASPFQHHGAFAWAVWWIQNRRQIEVPIGEAKEFLSKLVAGPLPRLDIPEELQFERVALDPVPVLKVRRSNDRYSAQPPVVADLWLDYDNWLVKFQQPEESSFQSDRRRLLVRNRRAETDAYEWLRAHGFRPTAYYRRDEGAFELPASKLAKSVRLLTAAGWRVEAEGKLYRSAGEIQIQVASGIDWFELHGTVVFGDVSAKLPALLAALKRGDETVVLDDGSIGMLPQEWLKKYGVLAGLGSAHDDHLRFTTAQIGLLDALLASQPEARCDEVFNRARQELQSFDGIAPADPPDGFTGQLRAYQRDGLGWLQFLQRFRFGGCLADDMGLGKTVQVLGLLETRRMLRAAASSPLAPREESGNQDERRLDPPLSSRGARGLRAAERPGPSLVVVPKSLVFNWMQEASRFTPQLRVLDHTGIERIKASDHFDEYDVILTTYGTLRRDALIFKDVEFDYCILDEAQMIKNAATESAKAARLLRARHRLAMSGTPIENHLGELWSLFEFLNPGMLGTASVFQLGGAGARNPDLATRELLSKALRPFILRRTKDQVAKDLPAKLEQTLFCELEPEQRKLYNELRDHYRMTLLGKVDRDGINKSKIMILEALLRLRQAACHPGLLDKKRDSDPSAKLDMLIPQLDEVIDEGHKVLVFSQFTSFLAILKKRLDAEKIPYEYLDGKTRNRGDKVDRFQTDPNCKLFLISLKAGGLGLNLTAAEYVFLLDPWWNPAVEAQAIDRTHRIGQTRQVFAYRLIVRNTVEEKVLELQNTKRNLADAIINADNSLIRDLGRDDLELLLS